MIVRGPEFQACLLNASRTSTLSHYHYRMNMISVGFDVVSKYKHCIIKHHFWHFILTQHCEQLLTKGIECTVMFGFFRKLICDLLESAGQESGGWWLVDQNLIDSSRPTVSDLGVALKKVFLKFCFLWTNWDWKPRYITYIRPSEGVTMIKNITRGFQVAEWKHCCLWSHRTVFNSRMGHFLGWLIVPSCEIGKLSTGFGYWGGYSGTVLVLIKKLSCIKPIAWSWMGDHQQ